MSTSDLAIANGFNARNGVFNKLYCNELIQGSFGIDPSLYYGFNFTGGLTISGMTLNFQYANGVINVKGNQIFTLTGNNTTSVFTSPTAVPLYARPTNTRTCICTGVIKGPLGSGGTVSYPLLAIVNSSGILQFSTLDNSLFNAVTFVFAEIEFSYAI